MLRKLSALVAATFGLSLLAGALPATAAQYQYGYDISWPQCSSTSPGSSSTFTGINAAASFAIIGVNDGKANTTNPCLMSQISQAQGSNLAVSYYQNTANPGSRSWPYGQSDPAVCPSNVKHLTEAQIKDCSEDYGYNAAEYGYTYGTSNASTIPNASTSGWWLDVESANSWSRDLQANIADIQGGLLYLTRQGISGGIYTNSSSWSSITGNDTAHFTGVRWWAPGLVSSNPTSAELATACGTSSLLGGSLKPRYIQYTQTYDTNYDCG